MKNTTKYLMAVLLVYCAGISLESCRKTGTEKALLEEKSLTNQDLREEMSLLVKTAYESSINTQQKDTSKICDSVKGSLGFSYGIDSFQLSWNREYPEREHLELVRFRNDSVLFDWKKDSTVYEVSGKPISKKTEKIFDAMQFLKERINN